MTTQRDAAQSYFILAQQFLLTASAVLEEMIAGGNKWVLVSDALIDEDEYDRQTRWSDFNTMLPALFLFFHGSELLCKGALLLHGQESATTHDLPTLLVPIEDHPDLVAVHSALSKYLAPGADTPHFLARYMNAIGKNSSFRTLYESLRYPVSRAGVAFDQSWLRHNSETVHDDLRTILADIRTVISVCVRASRSSPD